MLGFAAVVQVRANDADENFTGARQGDLIALINTLSQATDRARVELADLRRTRDSLLDDTEATRTALSVARAARRGARDPRRDGAGDRARGADHRGRRTR